MKHPDLDVGARLRRRVAPRRARVAALLALLCAAQLSIGCDGAEPPSEAGAGIEATTAEVEGATGEASDTGASSGTADADESADEGAARMPTDTVLAAADAAGLQVVIASTDLAVGRERVALGILDGSGAILPDARVGIRWFFLDGEEARPAGESEAIWYPSSLPGAGLYVTWFDFDRAGVWGAEIQIGLPESSGLAEDPPPQRIRFPVSLESAAPALGEPAPATRGRSLQTEADIGALTSDPDPDPDLYRLTVDEAVHSGRPTVLVFATPGFCQTRICGPVLEEIKALKADWQDRVDFVHVEVYQDFEPLTFADAMEDWGLSTEPWVFVIDAEGRVAARLEGSSTRAELEPILTRVVAGEQP